MKKIKPKYPVEYDNGMSFYGLHSCTTSKGIGKKTNYICTVEGCVYSTKVRINGTFDEMSCNESNTCPKHQVKLVNVGDVRRIPKKGKKRIKLQKQLKK